MMMMTPSERKVILILVKLFRSSIEVADSGYMYSVMQVYAGEIYIYKFKDSSKRRWERGGTFMCIHYTVLQKKKIQIQIQIQIQSFFHRISKH